MQETWGDNMKDRTPKFPGRVKLDPVAGQTNIYDMTRADEPDDTGTPFNKRTMLQESTAQFLKLPLANPFVDDALRHMVDRIVPIGTIRTSPAQNLGDAWLKCDGSAVTYGNYPQLCQLLRNSTETVTWSTNAFPTSYSIAKTSSPIYFDGRWIIAAANASTMLWILSAPTIDGEWTVEKTISANVESIDITADENYCLVAYGTESANIKLVLARAGASEWTNYALPSPKTDYSGKNTCVAGCSNYNGRFAVALGVKPNTKGYYVDFRVFYAEDPTAPSGWTGKVIRETGGMAHNYSFNCANGKWIFISATQSSGNADYIEIRVDWCDDASLFVFSKEDSFKASGISAYVPGGVSKVVYFNGKYYAAVKGGRTSGQDGISLLTSVDLATWVSGAIGESAAQSEITCSMAASDNMLIVADKSSVFTSTIPDDGFTVVSIPPGLTMYGVALKGALAVAAATVGAVYYDYTYASKLLPMISLSDDTTTFIKAKNELNVFESQQSGGD